MGREGNGSRNILSFTKLICETWNTRLGKNYHDIKSKAVPKLVFCIFIEESHFLTLFLILDIF